MPLPLDLRVNANDPTPIYLQMETQIRHRILSGALLAGTQLPAVRVLAQQLVINPNTVAKVYRDLMQAGLLSSRKGEGCYVAGSAGPANGRRRIEELRPQIRKLALEAELLGVDADDVAGELRTEMKKKAKGGNT